MLLHDRPYLPSSDCVIGCLERGLRDIVEVLEGANANKLNLSSSDCVIACFERFCALWVLAMGKVLFRSVTCLKKNKISLISEEHDLESQSDPTSSSIKEVRGFD